MNRDLPRTVVQVGLLAAEDKCEPGEENGQALHEDDELEAQHGPHLEALAEVAAQEGAETRRAQHHASCMFIKPRGGGHIVMGRCTGVDWCVCVCVCVCVVCVLCVCV